MTITTGATVYRTRARWIGDDATQTGEVLSVDGRDAVVTWQGSALQETWRVADLVTGDVCF